MRSFEAMELKEEPVVKPQTAPEPQPAPTVVAPQQEKPTPKPQPKPTEAKAQPKPQVKEEEKPIEKRKPSAFWKRTKLPWMLVFLYFVIAVVVWYGISNNLELELPYRPLSTVIIFLGLLAVVFLFLVCPEKLKVLPYIILAITIGAFFIAAPVFLRLAIPVVALAIIMIVRDIMNIQK